MLNALKTTRMLLIIPFADICGNFAHQCFNTPSINFNGFYFNFRYISMNDTENLTPYNSTLKSYNKLDFDNEHTVVTHEINFRGPRMDFWYNYLFPYDTGLTCSANMNAVISLSLIITCSIVLCLAIT